MTAEPFDEGLDPYAHFDPEEINALKRNYALRTLIALQEHGLVPDDFRFTYEMCLEGLHDAASQDVEEPFNFGERAEAIAVTGAMIEGLSNESYLSREDQESIRDAQLENCIAVITTGTEPDQWLAAAEHILGPLPLSDDPQERHERVRELQKQLIETQAVQPTDSNTIRARDAIVLLLTENTGKFDLNTLDFAHYLAATAAPLFIRFGGEEMMPASLRRAIGNSILRKSEDNGLKPDVALAILVEAIGYLKQE